MMSVHQFLSEENERAFVYNIFAATVVSKLCDHPVFFFKCLKLFLIDMHNRHMRN